jgi:putative endonuclease
MYDRQEKEPCVYILASERNGVLYVGVTSELSDRVSLHKQGFYEGFTKKHKVHRLVYFECHETMEQAIRREKQMKRWNRAWKVRLIEHLNPEWQDLWTEGGEVRGTGAGGLSPPDVRLERED